MQNDAEWTMKYYNEAAQVKIAERRQLWSPELQERISRQWTGADPGCGSGAGGRPGGREGASPGGALDRLVEEFTGGHPEVSAGLKKLYGDKANWPAQAKRRMEPFRINPEVWAFISRAMR